MIWVAAARLRTLPLSVAGIVTGQRISNTETRGFGPYNFFWHFTNSYRLPNTI